jgi:choline dehydrogenase-like flavoprotein
MGLPRLAVLPRPHGGRPPFEFKSLEFFQESPSVYSPRHTLDELIASQSVDYRPRVLVTSFVEREDEVEVCARRVDDDEVERFAARRLVLAAGAINTARVVLASENDRESELPLLENPAVQIPFVLIESLGAALERSAFGLVGLNLVWDSQTYGALCQGSIMEVTAPARAEFFPSLPYVARSNMSLIRHLLPAMFVMQFYLPGDEQRPSRMRLLPDGRLRVEATDGVVDLAAAAPMFRFFRRLGAWSHPRLAVNVPTGHAVHYAGTLPMRESPGRYECTPEGRLYGTRRVYVADSATFAGLPAKNMSFGMMANAMRVAGHAVEGLDR